MAIDEIRAEVDAWRSAGLDHAEALLVSTWRSAPRRPGARFLLGEDGSIAGNVSAGCVEADLAERLADVLAGAPGGAVTYGVSDDTAHGVGLACGGEIELLLSRRSAGDPVWSVLETRREMREASVIVTELTPDAGRWLLGPEGDVLAADRPDAPVPVGAVAVARSRADIEGTVRVDGALIEIVLPPRRLLVVGATPIGVALARLAAAASITVVVIEPRPAYAASVADPDTQVDAGIDLDARWPDDAMIDRVPDVATAIAVVAHDERIDTEALCVALGTPARYVGLLGGGRTRRRRFEALRSAGIDERTIDRVRAPIGLDLGAETPVEIAVAILAQIVADWRGG